VHQNRFETLLNDEEIDQIKSATRAYDTQLELEVNEELERQEKHGEIIRNAEEVSSQGFEFVDDTQDISKNPEARIVKDDQEVD